jgi:accessory gene regulator protein AgrB
MMVASLTLNQLSVMGFEPQTAGQPLVNVRKRTTKVNLVIVISIVVFLVIGILYAVNIAGKTERGETVPAPAR